MRRASEAATALLLGGALVALACVTCSRRPGGAPKHDASCRRELSTDELHRLQQRISNGESVCPELTAPRIEVDRNGVRLDGQALAGKPSERAIAKFSPLFDALKTGRETWQMLHPGETFAPTVTLVVTPDVTAFAGASVVRTAALSGHARFALETSNVKIDFVHPNPSSERPALERLRLARSTNGKVRVRFSGRITPRVGLDEPVAESDVARLIASECAKGSPPCVDEIVVELSGGSFVELAKVANSALRAPPVSARTIPLAFEPPEEVPKPPDRGDDPPKASKARVRFGVLTLEGPLTQEQVEGVVKSAESELRRCYERGLANNPHLQGRIKARFVIGRDGGVHSAVNAGSDLPDVRTVECVLAEIARLRFRKPEAAIATVTIPVLFTPD